MTPEQFTYWLHGFFEISDSPTLTAKQVEIVKDHLDLVFNKVTPNRNVESASSNNVGLPSKDVRDSLLPSNQTIKLNIPKDSILSTPNVGYYPFNLPSGYYC